MESEGRVVVVGSGAAGMAAAVAAAEGGARVTVLEAAPHIGGTTAISGAGIWIPASRPARESGIHDTLEAGISYLRSLGLGDIDEPLCETYVREGERSLDALNASAGLRWQHLEGFSDYHAELPGGTPLGRSLEITATRVPLHALAAVRPDPHGVGPVTITEEASAEPPTAEEQSRRDRDGVATRGRGLIAALYAALLERGGEVHVRRRAARLVTADGAVVGVEAEGEHHPGRVVLGSGGFERDPELVRSFLGGPLLAPAGPPTNRGDGLRMGMAVGAALGNMSEAWWAPAMQVVDGTIDDAPLYRMLFMDLARPGGLLVDQNAASASSTRRRTTTTSVARCSRSTPATTLIQPCRAGMSSTPLAALPSSARSSRAIPTRTGSFAPIRLMRSPHFLSFPAGKLGASVARFNELAAAWRRRGLRARQLRVGPCQRRPRRTASGHDAAVLCPARPARVPRDQGRSAD